MQIAFPNHYYCRDNFDKQKCVYDYRGIGRCVGQYVNCSNANLNSDEKVFCNDTSWYDPHKLNYMGSLFKSDYLPFVRLYTNLACNDPLQKPRRAGE